MLASLLSLCSIRRSKQCKIFNSAAGILESLSVNALNDGVASDWAKCPTIWIQQRSKTHLYINRVVAVYINHACFLHL